MTPSQIDTDWLAATAPFRAKFERANALDAKAAKYRKFGGSYAAQADEFEQQAHEIRQATIEERNEVEAPFRAEWNRRGGWERAYIVPDGHIHKTTACHSLYPTTIIAWLPEQSGLSEDEIVEFAGVHACTICYPSAPVDALRAAEAAAKAATECPGSRSYDYEPGSHRQTSYTGTGRAKCKHCGQHVGTSKIGKMRAHKPADTKEG